jgi:hypothetical protein
MIAQNSILILFSLQIKIEWIKASLVNMDLFNKKKRIGNFLEVFWCTYKCTDD